MMQAFQGMQDFQHQQDAQFGAGAGFQDPSMQANLTASFPGGAAGFHDHMLQGSYTGAMGNFQDTMQQPNFAAQFAGAPAMMQDPTMQQGFVGQFTGMQSGASVVNDFGMPHGTQGAYQGASIAQPPMTPGRHSAGIPSGVSIVNEFGLPFGSQGAYQGATLSQPPMTPGRHQTGLYSAPQSPAHFGMGGSSSVARTASVSRTSIVPAGGASYAAGGYSVGPSAAAVALDAADGVLDGTYFGAPILDSGYGGGYIAARPTTTYCREYIRPLPVSPAHIYSREYARAPGSPLVPGQVGPARTVYEGPPLGSLGHELLPHLYDRSAYDRPVYDRPPYTDRSTYDRPSMYPHSAYDRPPVERPLFDRPPLERPGYDDYYTPRARRGYEEGAPRPRPRSAAGRRPANDDMPPRLPSRPRRNPYDDGEGRPYGPPSGEAVREPRHPPRAPAPVEERYGRRDYDGPRRDFDGPRRDYDEPRRDYDGPRREYNGRRDFGGSRSDYDGPRREYDPRREQDAPRDPYHHEYRPSSHRARDPIERPLIEDRQSRFN